MKIISVPPSKGPWLIERRSTTGSLTYVYVELNPLITTGRSPVRRTLKATVLVLSSSANIMFMNKNVSAGFQIYLIKRCVPDVGEKHCIMFSEVIILATVLDPKTQKADPFLPIISSKESNINVTSVFPRQGPIKGAKLSSLGVAT